VKTFAKINIFVKSFVKSNILTELVPLFYMMLTRFGVINVSKSQHLLIFAKVFIKIFAKVFASFVYFHKQFSQKWENIFAKMKEDNFLLIRTLPSFLEKSTVNVTDF
jgi:positive regulator of sigma E activity